MLLNKMNHDIFWYTELNSLETSSSRQRVVRRQPCQLQQRGKVKEK